jgi:RimJ/RimL family protein N-acetyltransferase
VISAWRVVTARLVMTPVAPRDLRELAALKADPRAFAQMLGGVRSARQSADELAQDIQGWGADGFGMWTVRLREGGRFLGLAGLMHREDGRGIALRFALWPDARGIGLASEAAGAALTYGHEFAGLERIIGVAREQNFASRMVLGAVGMTEVERFTRHGIPLLVYQSVRRPNVW